MIETLRHIDHSAFHFINYGLANPVFDALCPIFRNKLTWIPLYIILAFFFYRKYGTRILVIGALTGLTVLLTDQISSSLIKPFVHRLRPCNNPAVHARLLLAYCGAGYSFVSSHAANHFGIAAVLIPFTWVNRKLYGSLLLLWAFLVSFSQVYVGVHFPVDVIAGGMLGLLIGSLVALIGKRWVPL